jgi:hypothetical protein
MGGVFTAALVYCFNVKKIDLCGDKHFDDYDIAHLLNGDIKL